MRDYKEFFLKLDAYYYPSTILFRGVELKLIKEKFSSVLKLRRVLDLGCGDGIAASMVFDKMIDYGLDLSKGDLDRAKKRKVYKKLLLGDARKIPLGNGRLDLVFSNCVIEHINDLDKVLSEVKRVLRAGGYFVFTTPTENFKKYSVFSFLHLDFLARIYGISREKRLHHYNCYSLKEWSRVLRKNGFNVVDGYYYFGRKEMEFWDLLATAFYFLDKMNKRLCIFIYNKFLRNFISKRIIGSLAGNDTCAGVCVMAKKI